ncbi:MAG: ankyrin repeat domain-containing protein [Verrucomicrobiales bacterium]|nr:ankyrin repeat domain-containing protein [Verrucomicrobiales bacterium]
MKEQTKFILTSIVLALSCCACAEKNNIIRNDSIEEINKIILNNKFGSVSNERIEEIDLNQRFSSDPELSSETTLLHSACFAGDEPAVKRLLTHGADPHVRDGFGALPIEVALEKKYNSIAVLLDEFSDSSEKEEPGWEEIVPLILINWNLENLRLGKISVDGIDIDQTVFSGLMEEGNQTSEKDDKTEMKILITKVSQDHYAYTVEVDVGFLEGGAETGAVRKRHGFWIIEDEVTGVR